MRKRSRSGPRIRLHLGAHRTATTALQATLQDNVTLLADHDIGVLTRWRAGERGEQGLRKVTHRLGQAARHKGATRWLKLVEAKRDLSSLLRQQGQALAILSDENLLGHTFAYDGNCAIYPQCQQRLSMLARCLGAPPDHVHLTIRDYASFLVSIYAMAVLYRSGAPRFDDIRHRKLALPRRWPDVMAAVRLAFPASTISFACYEDGAVERALVALLQPTIDIGLLRPAMPGVNRAPTADAIEAALIERPRTLAEADALNRRFADGRIFNPLSEEERTALSERYREDLMILRRDYIEIGAMPMPVSGADIIAL